MCDEVKRQNQNNVANWFSDLFNYFMIKQSDAQMDGENDLFT